MSSPKVEPRPLERPLSEIAADILNDYQDKPSFYMAKPYVFALLTCPTTDLGGYYYEDPLDELLIRLLGNLAFWRGQCAQRIKNELRAALADYQQRKA